MSENPEKFEKMPNQKKPDYSNDWVAAGILGLLLLLAIAGSPAMRDKKEKSDTIKNTENADVVPGALHKQGVTPDPSLLFFKKAHEKSR